MLNGNSTNTGSGKLMDQVCLNIKISDVYYCFSRALFVALLLASQNVGTNLASTSSCFFLSTTKPALPVGPSAWG
jgi:hypothetical protein